MRKIFVTLADILQFGDEFQQDRRNDAYFFKKAHEVFAAGSPVDAQTYLSSIKITSRFDGFDDFQKRVETQADQENYREAMRFFLKRDFLEAQACLLLTKDLTSFGGAADLRKIRVMCWNNICYSRAMKALIVHDASKVEAQLRLVQDPDSFENFGAYQKKIKQDALRIYTPKFC